MTQVSRRMVGAWLLTVTTALALPASAAGPAATQVAQAAGGGVTEVTFFYPVAVAGPITRILDGYVEEFNKATPDVKVISVFSGSYADTLTKIQTAVQGGGKPPQVAVLGIRDLHVLADGDMIVPVDDRLTPADLGDLHEAFMVNARFRGKIWSVPFQRSTPVLYYNKDHFREAGLDPEKAPRTWAEQLEFARKLTRPEGPNQRWGLSIWSDQHPYWALQGLTLGNGKNIIGDAANKVFFNDPAVVEGLQAWVDLSRKHKVMAEGTVQWATAPSEFTGGRVSMIWHSSGSLSSIMKEAKFPVGVGVLPGLKQPGAPVGGANLYLFKKSSDQEKAAAWKFVQFLTSPERAARWSIDTGYVAVRKSSYDTPVMKDYGARVPQALVARDQLRVAGKELATHNTPQVTKILNDNIQAAMLGTKTPQQALDDAQRDSERILRQFND